MRKLLIFIGIVLVAIAFADFNDVKTSRLDVAEIIGKFIGRELPYWSGGMYFILFGSPKSKWRTFFLWVLTILIILIVRPILLSFL